MLVRLNIYSIRGTHEYTDQVKKKEDEMHKREVMHQAAVEVLSSRFIDFTSLSLCMVLELLQAGASTYN